MTERKESSFKRTWEILLPFAIYYVVHDVAVLLLMVLASQGAQLLGDGWREAMLGNESTVNGILNAMAMLIGMAAVLPMAMKEILHNKEEGEKPAEKRVTAYALLTVLAVAFALGINILLALAGLTEISQTYDEVVGKQFGVAFGIGLLLYGVCSPLVEEVVFRGLVYNRMKRYFPLPLSVVVCGVLFGIYHGNLVQGVYGSIMGIAITFVYELYGSFLAPVLFHAAANISVFTAGYGQQALRGMMTVPCCVIFLAISCGCFVLMWRLREACR